MTRPQVPATSAAPAAAEPRARTSRRVERYPVNAGLLSGVSPGSDHGEQPGRQHKPTLHPRTGGQYDCIPVKLRTRHRHNLARRPQRHMALMTMETLQTCETKRQPGSVQICAIGAHCVTGNNKCCSAIGPNQHHRMRYINRAEQPAALTSPDELTSQPDKWCCERGLNSRPHHYQWCALPLSYRSVPGRSRARGSACIISRRWIDDGRVQINPPNAVSGKPRQHCANDGAQPVRGLRRRAAIPAVSCSRIRPTRRGLRSWLGTPRCR